MVAAGRETMGSQDTRDTRMTCVVGNNKDGGDGDDGMWQTVGSSVGVGTLCLLKRPMCVCLPPKPGVLVLIVMVAHHSGRRHRGRLQAHVKLAVLAGWAHTMFVMNFVLTSRICRTSRMAMNL
jgi:hypothetical protein